MPVPDEAVASLLDDVIRTTMDANPGLGRGAGDHSFDGVLPAVGTGAVQRRIDEIDALLDRLESVGAEALDAEGRADVGTARGLLLDERFHRAVLRDHATDPQWAAAATDVWTYVARPYAPVADRAAAMCRHLEQLPEWLTEAEAVLEPELDPGPRRVAVDIARGAAAFYRDDARGALGEIADPTLRARVDRAVEAGAAACERLAEDLERRAARPDGGLGAETFCAMLAAQEGVTETAPALRSRVDAELARLGERTTELVAQLGAGDAAAAFHRLESERTSAGGLVPAASGMVEALEAFWRERDAVTMPEGVRCRVIETPPFYAWVTAAYDCPGPLEPAGLEHFYFVTPVDPRWSARQADDWLAHLNLPSLENISVHEVFPGHFVHIVAAHAQPSLTRKLTFFSGFGEGWAHYTELLAVEQGLADGRPLLELAMLQDALLRACRFSAAVGMHAEGMTLDAATRLFEEQAHLPRLAAEREALRGTHDPMYLVYTYGKMEILRWREELSRRPDFDLRRFHDRMLRCGLAPLGVVRDYTLDC